MTPPAPEGRKPIILIVDDTPTNLKVLFDYLGEQSYDILVAEDGESAIEQAELSAPDLILLDVMLPGIDGFETCARLKALEVTREVPVIFMTALSDTQYVVQSFEAGAVDYLTKPLRQEEVSVRVKTHIGMRRLQHDLQAEIARRRLAEAERREINAGQEQFCSSLAHAVKRLLHQVLSTSEHLRSVAPSIPREDIQALAQEIHDTARAIERLLRQIPD